MRVVFLDYDGVVNTPMWTPDGKRCRFGMPSDGKVNNFQSVQWVSEFCERYDYSIVVSSTWRFHDNYSQCLINGGLREGLLINGRTPILRGETRGAEIKQYLSLHPEVEAYLIFDDENDMDDLTPYLVKCDSDIGFGLREFKKAEKLHGKYWGVAKR